MQGDDKVIAALNKCLGNELGAIHQYYLHARICAHRGLGKLAAAEREAALAEMRHADRFIDRILFLEGAPRMGDVGELALARDTAAILQSDLAAERRGAADLRTGIAAALAAGDAVSENLFKATLADEEAHIEFLETQLELIERIGLANYEQARM